MKFLILGKPVDIEALPRREATEEERRKMLGSVATVYEMKNPIFCCVDSGSFYPITTQDVEIDLDLPGNVELVILQTDIFLHSLYKKFPKKKRKKI
jgi:hypothetical protein